MVMGLGYFLNDIFHAVKFIDIFRRYVDVEIAFHRGNYSHVRQRIPFGVILLFGIVGDGLHIQFLR
jgi:hypothetical protein